jgi:hypothetical protein
VRQIRQQVSKAYAVRGNAALAQTNDSWEEF